MIKTREVVSVCALCGAGAFFRVTRDAGPRTGAEAAAGLVVFLAVFAAAYNRSPRFAAAVDSRDNAAAVSGWFALVAGTVLALFGLVCIGAGGCYIVLGLALVVAGALLVIRGRRTLRDRRWRRSHRGLFM